MTALPPKHWCRQMNNSDKLSSSSALHGWWSGGFSSSRRQNIWNCTLHTSAPPASSSENNISLYSEDTIKGSGFTFPLIWSTFSSSKSFSSIFLLAVTLTTTGDADPLPLVFTTSSSTGLFSSNSRVFSSSIGKAAVFPPDFWRDRRWNVGNICYVFVLCCIHTSSAAFSSSCNWFKVELSSVIFWYKNNSRLQKIAWHLSKLTLFSHWRSAVLVSQPLEIWKQKIISRRNADRSSKPSSLAPRGRHRLALLLLCIFSCV